MANIKADFFDGGQGQNSKESTASRPSLALVLRDIADDLTAIRAALVGVTAKLDLDATVTDTDYASLHDPAALKTAKV